MTLLWSHMGPDVYLQAHHIASYWVRRRLSRCSDCLLVAKTFQTVLAQRNETNFGNTCTPKGTENQQKITEHETVESIFQAAGRRACKCNLAPHCEEQSPVGDAFLNAIEEASHILSTTPYIGSPRYFSHLELQKPRFLPLRKFEKYLLFYRNLEEEEAVEMVRIVHSAMDLPRLFGGTES